MEAGRRPKPRPKYYDPLKIDAEAELAYGMPWLAAFWPVGDKGWFACVQERRDKALKPVREIQEGLIKYVHRDGPAPDVRGDLVVFCRARDATRQSTASPTECGLKDRCR